ncbi:unannotated protein [freshwater metagenome]|uniref:Unannotated protein n=1 Tax=freshwater metagenome TaxID=449393 RepID=A0A6J6TPM4_9ZZZZ
MIFRRVVRCTPVSATEAPAALLLERSDADLIAAVRAGDLESYGELFARHAEAARRLARQLTRGSGDAEDLVSDAFAKVMEVLRRGGGPDEAFRAYLLTSLRRLHVDRTRVTARATPTDDIAAYDAGVPFHDTAVAGFENEAAAEAFASLPERWQLVLWHTEVEGAKPADVAPLLGMSPNSVAALAYRAREGLREAFLAAHAARSDDQDCRTTQGRLGAYVRGNSSRRDAGKVEEHLEGCRRCAGIYLELVEVNSGLGALLAPLLLGGAAAAYVGSGAVAVTAATGAATGVGWTGWLLAVPGRIRDLALANLPATAAAGVATAAVVGGSVVAGVAITSDDPPREAATTAPASPGAAEDDAVDPAGEPAPGNGDAAAREEDDAPGDTGFGTDPTDPALDGLPADELPADEPPSDGAPTDEVPVEAPPGDESPTEEAPEPPGDGPGPQPGPEPQPEPQPQPEPEPEPTPPLTAEGRATTALGLSWRVVLDVAGLEEGTTGRVRLTSDRPLLALTLDRRCAGLALGPASCSLSGGTYTFRALPAPGQRTTLTFEVETADGRTTTVRVPLA